MTKRRIASRICAFLAALCAAAAIAVAALCQKGSPEVLLVPEDAVQQAQNLMDALCAGDFDKAQAALYGSWDLGAVGEPSDPVGAILWNAYVDSLSYELEGGVYATPTGLAQNVRLTHLSFETLTANLGSRSRTLLQEAVDAAEDVSQLYDEKNGYREELVMEILQTAAAQAAREDLAYVTEEIPLQLIYQDGAWWVVADQTLLKAISGGITG